MRAKKFSSKIRSKKNGPKSSLVKRHENPGMTGELRLERAMLMRTNEELKESLKRYMELYDGAPMGFITLEGGGRMTAVNQAGAELLGQSQTKLMGNPFVNFLADECRQDFLKFLAQSRRRKRRREPGAVELTLKGTGEGKPVTIELVHILTRGKLPYEIWECVFFDVTKRKMAEERILLANGELAWANRAKDEFLAALSHELRTPLNPILLIASDAAKDLELPPRIRAWFHSIRGNVELAVRLIDDLLDLARINSGKPVLAQAPLRVHDLLKDCLEILKHDIAVKEIVLVKAFNATADSMVGDAARAKQIFLNLLKNAVKFTGKGGKVTVRTETDGGMIRISITDTGIGMTRQEMATVFEAFSQGEHAHPGGSHEYGGLGLGLAISRKLAELHGGEIVAVSKGRGHGSTFSVAFPLLMATRKEQAAMQPKVMEPGDPSFQPHLKILLVEDHAPTRAALAQLLARRNHKVEMAGSIKEAEHLAAEREFDLLISDIGLPDGSGYELVNELHKTSDIKSIALTGYGMDEDVERSEKEGFLLHLTKPVSISALESALMAVTAK